MTNGVKLGHGHSVPDFGLPIDWRPAAHGGSATTGFHLYRADIDGLRAIAVIAVVLFHANRLVPGGYVGVDVFFVISGFLITSLIRKDLNANNFRLSQFWERRIRRIFPAQALLTSVVLLSSMLFFLPADLVALCKSSLSQSVFLSNAYFFQNTDYFDGPADLKPLLHMWSLAVEEQFYLFFPLFLVACRRLQHSTLGAAIAIAATASFVLSVWGTIAYPAATFFLLPTRAWELLIGALLTFTPSVANTVRIRSWRHESASTAGLLAIFAACALFDDTMRFPGAAAVLPCGGAALIIQSNRVAQTWVGRVLATPPMVFVGLISYSLYLWHWPVLAFCRYLSNQVLDGRICALAVAGSCIAGWLSWKYVETPFRHRLTHSSVSRVFSTALAASAAIMAVSVIGWQTRGLPERFPKEVLELADGAVVSHRFETLNASDVTSGTLPIVGEFSPRAASDRFLLWGDSHAMAITDLVDRIARKHSIAGRVATRRGTAPVIGTWCHRNDRSALDWNRAILEFIELKGIHNVILAARWSGYTEGQLNGSPDNFLVDTMSNGATRGEAKQALKRGMERTIDRLRRAGVRVWIVTQAPEQTVNPRRALALRKFLPWHTPDRVVSLAEHRRRQANADEVLSAFEASDVRLCDTADGCFDKLGNSRIGEGGRSYYLDQDHLSPSGADVLLGDMINRVFEEIAADCRE